MGRAAGGAVYSPAGGAVYSSAGGSMEDTIARSCRDFGVPQWVKAVLEAAAKMKDDKQRRRKAYRMLRRQLWDAGIGHECAPFPTYVYPVTLKDLVRSLFPGDICNYPDPDHEKVVKVTMEDLFLVKVEKRPKPTVKCMKADPDTTLTL